MELYMPLYDDEPDWQIDPNGLYIATRGFLIRRGYCCGNQCRNCPYINWRSSPDWGPGPAEAVQFAKVVPKVIDGAKRWLTYHEQLLEKDNGGEQSYHTTMVEHYKLLLERWEE